MPFSEWVLSKRQLLFFLSFCLFFLFTLPSQIIYSNTEVVSSNSRIHPMINPSMDSSNPSNDSFMSSIICTIGALTNSRCIVNTMLSNWQNMDKALTSQPQISEKSVALLVQHQQLHRKPSLSVGHSMVRIHV